MKVRLVTPALDGLPGQQAYADALALHLPGKVSVVSLPKPEAVESPAGRTLAAWAGYPFVKRDGADIVHGTDTFCTVKDVDVLTIHDLIPLTVSSEPTARLHFRFFGRRIRQVPLVIVPTRTWAHRLVSLIGIEPSRIRVIPQGCDLAIARKPLERPTAMSPDKRSILVVGAYRPYKRILELVEAVRDVPDVRIVRIGPPNGSYAKQCQRAASRTGVDLVDVGPVPLRRIPDYYGHADLLYYASEEEGFGLPPLEAMACGKTSLLSDIPVFREVYGDLALYLPGKDASIREAVLNALEHPKAPERLRQHAARFTWSATAQNTMSVYEELVRDADPVVSLLLDGNRGASN
jgi:glycosyltransferase involved in cell wall biosynthesis